MSVNKLGEITVNKTLSAIFAAALSIAFNATAAAAGYEMRLDAVAPATASAGATVRLTGSNFGAAQAGHRVVLRDDKTGALQGMRVSSWSNTQITAVVPAQAKAGANTIAILNPVGQAGPVNASRHAPFTVMASLKPGVLAKATTPAAGIGKTPAGVLPKASLGAIGCTVDLAVEPLRVYGLRGGINGLYGFTVEGNVKNAGTTAFTASAGQTQYTLRLGSRVLKTGNITTLAPGARIRADHIIDGWRLSDEFPPNFTLELAYDPDIRIDNNTQNDDCRMTNNKQTLSGAEVLRLIRLSVR